MALDESPLREPSLDQLAKSISTWIGIGGAVFGVLSFCILLGIWFGPLKDMPQRFDNIMTQLSEIKSRSDKTDWAMDSLKSKADSLSVQVTNTTNELRQAKDDLRTAELKLAQVDTMSVKKVEFLEWKAELEKQNNNITAPVLKKIP